MGEDFYFSKGLTGSVIEKLLLTVPTLETSSNTLSDEIKNTKTELVTSLSNHETADSIRWQQIGDAVQGVYARVLEDVESIIEGRILAYDTTKPVQIFGTKGLLTLGGNSTWSATSNGVVIVVYSAILGIAPVLYVNNTPIEYSGLSLLGSGEPSSPIPISVNDIISANGVLGLGSSFNVTFYPTKL